MRLPTRRRLERLRAPCPELFKVAKGMLGLETYHFLNYKARNVGREQVRTV